VPLAISTRYSIFREKYFLPALPLLALLVAHGASRMPGRLLPGLVGVAVIGLNLTPLPGRPLPQYGSSLARLAPGQWVGYRPVWAKLARYLDSSVTGNPASTRPPPAGRLGADLVLCHSPGATGPLRFYRKQSFDLVGFPPHFLMTEADRPALDRLAAGRRRVWLIWCTPHDPRNIIRSTLSARFEGERRLGAWWGSDAKVEVFLYEKRPLAQHRIPSGAEGGGLTGVRPQNLDPGPIAREVASGWASALQP